MKIQKVLSLFDSDAYIQIVKPAPIYPPNLVKFTKVLSLKHLDRNFSFVFHEHRLFQEEKKMASGGSGAVSVHVESHGKEWCHNYCMDQRKVEHIEPAGLHTCTCVQ